MQRKVTCGWSAARTWAEALSAGRCKPSSGASSALCVTSSLIRPMLTWPAGSSASSAEPPPDHLLELISNEARYGRPASNPLTLNSMYTHVHAMNSMYTRVHASGHLPLLKLQLRVAE